MAIIEVTCPNPECGTRLKAPAERVGKMAKCKKCRQGFRVPGPPTGSDTVGEPNMLSTLDAPAPPLPRHQDDDDEKTELLPMDAVPPAPKSKFGAPVPSKNLADLPSADAFDFPKSSAPPKSQSGERPAVPKAAPPIAQPAKAPPVAQPAAPPKSRPAAKPIDDVEQTLDDPERLRKSAVPDKRKSAAAAPAPVTDPEPAPAANPFAFGDEPASPAKSKRNSDEDDDDRPRKRRRDQDEEDDRPRGKRRPDDDEDDNRRRKSRNRADDEEEEDRPRKRRRDDEEDEDRPRKKRGRDDDDDTPARKKARGDDDEDDGDARPRYRRPDEKGSGMGKALVFTGIVGAIALVLGIAALVVFVRSKQPPPEVKDEKKDEKKDEAPPALAGGPAVAPKEKEKDKADLKKPKEPEPKPKDKEPEPKPKEKEPDPKPKEKEKAEPKPKDVPTRPTLTIEAGTPTYLLGKEPAEPKLDDTPAEGQFSRVQAEVKFTDLARIFPPSEAGGDLFLVARTATGYALDTFTPSGGDKRAARLLFSSTLPYPICDVHAKGTEARFLAAYANRITVWDLAGGKAEKLKDAFDPYATKADQKYDLAAAYFGTDPDQLVTVSTSGAVHLIDLKSGAPVAEFVPPHGAKGKVALGESVNKAEGGSIVLYAGGVVYQIATGGTLQRVREYDLRAEAKPLAIAASGTPGRVLLALEADLPNKKGRGVAVLHLPPGDKSLPNVFVWPAAAGRPKGALWADGTSAAVYSDLGAVWCDLDGTDFAPILFLRPKGGGTFESAGTHLWYAVPHPSRAGISVVVRLGVRFNGAAAFREVVKPNGPLPTAQLGANGLAK